MPTSIDFSFLVLWLCTLLCKLGMYEGTHAVLVVLNHACYGTLLKSQMTRYVTSAQAYSRNLLPGPPTHCHPANPEALQNAACRCPFWLLLLREPGFAQAGSQCRHLASLPALGVDRSLFLQAHQSSPEPRNLQLCLWRAVQWTTVMHRTDTTDAYAKKPNFVWFADTHLVCL